MVGITIYNKQGIQGRKHSGATDNFILSAYDSPNTKGAILKNKTEKNGGFMRGQPLCGLTCLG